MKKIVVIGGGAAGLVAGISAARLGAEVTIVEKNKILGKKLLITGKGRCNLTNICDTQVFFDNVVRNPKFLYSAYNRFNSKSCISFFEQLGVPLKVERGNRVFPVSDCAADIRNALKKELCRLNVKFRQDNIRKVCKQGDFIVSGDNDYICQGVIIATGGISYPATGSTGDGYLFAKSLGHNIITPSLSLVPLVDGANICAHFSGLSLKNIEIKVFDTKLDKVVYTKFGELLFTHTGLSGPVILSASAHLCEQRGRYIVYIDLKPALSEKQLEQRLLRDFDKSMNKDIENVLASLLPRAMIAEVVERSGILCHTKINSITKTRRKSLISVIKGFAVKIDSKCGAEEAIITAGGVDTREIDPKTMSSKLVNGLYFAGEVIDVDAYTGGFNLQIAFCTGHLAGACAAV